MKKMKAGYKQTEIGIIPEDWKLISYDDAFLFLSTATYSRAELSSKEIIKYIHYGDIHTRFNHFLNLENELPAVSVNQSKRYSPVKNGDLVMADASEDYEGVGKSVEIINSKDIKAISGLHTFLFRDKDDYFANGFKAFISENVLVKNSFRRLATGMKVYGVSKTNLKTILIPLPNLEEQQSIAEVLTDTDELIQNLKTLIAKKKAIKQGAMQELLTGKKRLKGFDGDWEMKKLGEIAEFYKGKALSKSQLKIDGKNKCIHYGELFTKYSEIITTVKSRTNLAENIFLSKVNDILMPTSDVTPNGLATASCVNENGIILGGDILIIRVSKSILNGIFFSFLISISKDKIMQLVSGSTVYHLYASDMSLFEFNLPKDIKEQRAIAEILSDMDLEIETLEIQLQKTQNLKQGMMQELLTGKTRLVNVKSNEDELLLVAEEKAVYEKNRN